MDTGKSHLRARGIYDSTTERDFADALEKNDAIKLYAKIPGWFKLPTPLGTYNPDWAVVFENDTRVYFVAETKSSTVEGDRRKSENLKIQCGRKHFGLAGDVVFKDVTRLEELVG